MKSLALAALVAFSLIAIGGQAPNGMISGTVRDSSGNTFPGATITATHVDIGKVTTVLTNENGVYIFSNLPAGTYVVTAGLPGFATQRSNGLPLGPSSSLRQDFALSFQGTSPFDRFAIVNIVADRQSSQGGMTNYRGHVRMTTDSTIIQADELDFNSQTQQADVRGNVSVQLRQIGARAIPLANVTQ